MPTMLGYYGYFDQPGPTVLDQRRSDAPTTEALPIRLVVAFVVRLVTLGFAIGL
jgi:hypothetical protein